MAEVRDGRTLADVTWQPDVGAGALAWCSWLHVFLFYLLSKIFLVFKMLGKRDRYRGLFPQRVAGEHPGAKGQKHFSGKEVPSLPSVPTAAFAIHG